MRLIIIKNKGIKKSKKNLQNTSLDDKMSTWSPAVLNDTAVKSRGGEFDEKVRNYIYTRPIIRWRSS